MSSIPQELPPVSTSPQPPVGFTLFDANAVALATLFGTPVAGATLMLINDRRLGRMGRGIAIFAIAVVVTAGTIAIGWNMPRGATSVIGLVLLLGMRRLAAALQGAAVNEHMQRGGRAGSKWAALGVGAAYFAALFAIVFFIFYIPTYKATHEPKVLIGSKDEVYYTGGITQAQALALGKALKATGYFADNGTTVKVNRGQDGPVVSFVVKEGIWDKPDMVSSFDEMGREVAPEVGGFPIQVQLLNKDLEVKQESAVGEYSAGNDHVFYLGSATATQAQGLAEALKASGFFEGTGADVMLSRHADGTTISFVVGDGAWDDAGLVASFEKIARDAAPVVGGLPIRLRLENTSLEVKKEETLK
jgi:hypothetical protein